MASIWDEFQIILLVRWTGARCASAWQTSSLSYSSQDRDRVRRAHDAPVEMGFEVFWDQKVPTGTKSATVETSGSATERSRVK